MSTTSNLITLTAFAGAAAVGFAIFKARIVAKGGGSNLESKFKAKAFLTANELEFLGRLETAAPELRFHAQVSMGALLDPAVSRKDGKAFFRLRGMFAQKIVDFVAQSRKDGSIVAIIELDDRTHNGEKDVKRDAMLTCAGYRIVRWHSKTKPAISAIRAELISPLPLIKPATIGTAA
jgi:very-short-patch-repair endonuclease